VIAVRDGREVAVRCECRGHKQRAAALRSCQIPARYAHCTIDGFELWDVHNPSLEIARRRTREFVDCYPAVERGLLYTGRVGTGKTHLAVAALRELVESKSVRGLYVNALELVQQLQIAFEGGSPSREELLGGVTEAEVLVLDELGAGKLTDWVRDLLYYVVNSRYMAKRVTIFTTNYMDSPQPPRRDGVSPAKPANEGVVSSAPAERWQETLADRISDRLRSRLHEMCDVIELRGEDYRARRTARGGRRS
jgi:DNA replication protein DnaC